MTNYWHQYLEKLKDADLLISVQRYVSTGEEMAEITDRQASLPGGGKTLLFENTGSAFPIATNLFASQKHIALAFGQSRNQEVYDRIRAILEATRGGITQAKLFKTMAASRITLFAPKTISTGQCQEVALFPPDLYRIPFLKNRPDEGAHGLSLVTMVIKDPNDGIPYVFHARALYHSKSSVMVRIEPGSQAARLIAQYPQSRVPMAIFFGGDPIYDFMSDITLPVHANSFLIAGFLRKKAVMMVPCLSQPLEVPENSDVVIEGYIDKRAARVEAPSCTDASGFYAQSGQEPLLHISCITHCKNAIISASIVDIKPQRSKTPLSQTMSEISSIMLRHTVSSDVNQIWFPPCSTFGNVAVVSIRKFYNAQPFAVAHALWGTPGTELNKILIVVDQQVNIHNMAAVEKCIAHYYRPATDTLFSSGPLSITDQSSLNAGFGGKICIDATAKEGETPLDAQDTAESGCCFYHASEGKQILKKQPNRQIYIQLDDNVDLSHATICLWLTVSLVDPTRDVTIVDGKLFVNACSIKQDERDTARPAPRVSCSGIETITAVDEYWDKLELGETLIASPSRVLHHLLRRDAAAER